MKDQVHIRNAEAAHLARALARQTGRTISEVVLEALRQYQPRRRMRSPKRRVEHWRRLLRADRKAGMVKPELPIEGFYDEATGLPK
jgi:hypothetical protein